MFPVYGGTAPGFTSASVLVSDPFGDSAGAGLTGAWTGGDVESIGMGHPTGAVARLSSIVTVSITEVPALVIVLGWTSAVVAGSTAALPECAPAPLAASIMEAQQGGFPPVARAVEVAAGVSAARSRLFDHTSGVLRELLISLGKLQQRKETMLRDAKQIWRSSLVTRTAVLLGTFLIVSDGATAQSFSPQNSPVAHASASASSPRSRAQHKTFPSAEDAADALYTAAKKHD